MSFRLVGLGRALEIAAFDEWISAEQALNWGLVSRVVSPEQLVVETLSWASRLADRSNHTFATVKQLLNESWNTPLETQLEHERQGLVRTVEHSDGQEGLSAFLENGPHALPEIPTALHALSSAFRISPRSIEQQEALQLKIDQRPSHSTPWDSWRF